MSNKIRVHATINGQPRDFLCEPQQSLLECLREVLGLTGTKEGCNDGNCGACSVLLNGRLVNSCLVLGAEIEGMDVVTVEGLADWRGLHPLQQAFIEMDALQCGYCTPGVLMAAKALLDRNPHPTDEEIRTWLAGNLCRCTGYDKIVRAVHSAAERLAAGIWGRVSPDPRQGDLSAQDGLRVVGTRPVRYDAADKATGRAIFGADVSLPGMIYGQIVRSPHAHARILGINTSAAEALPGVMAVVSANDLGLAADKTAQLGEGSINYKYMCDNTLASDKVLYVGHAVAAVAAITPTIAEQAAKLIRVSYQPLPAVVDLLEAAKEGAPLLHENMHTRSLAGESASPSNVSNHIQYIKGDPDEGFAQADVVVEREFRSLMVHQGYIEPHAAVAEWDALDNLKVYASTQGSFAIRDQLAELLHYPLSMITVVPTEVGGAFGGKNEGYVEAAAALLARKARRPVKVVMSRSDVFLGSGPSSGTVIKVKMGATREGRITAAQATLYYEAGAYPGSPVGSGARHLFAAYDIPNGRLDGYDVVVNKPKVGSYRAPGVTPTSLACESVIDELARAIGMDPIEFRLKNAATEGSTGITGRAQGEGGSLQVLKAALAHPNYSAPLGGPNRGRGIAFSYWGNWGAQSSSAITVNSDGTINLVTSSVDLSGTRTTLAMQVAEVLGLELSQIKSTVGDSSTLGYADVSAGSRTTFATGVAVVKAAQDVVAQMGVRAAVLWDVSPDTVTFDKGGFSSSSKPDERVTFAELAAMQGEMGGTITGVGNVNVEHWGGAFGVHIADVEVDPETGKVELLRYAVVQDAGRAIHPSLVEGQMAGGAAQGAGWALYEGYAYDAQGRMLNSTFLDYKIPTALDMPAVDTVIVEVPYAGHPFGVRGVGENPIVPPPGAIANAIYAAVGIRPDRLPMTPAHILQKLGVI